jgi:hypothetical protein
LLYESSGELLIDVPQAGDLIPASPRDAQRAKLKERGKKKPSLEAVTRKKEGEGH